jgi:ribosomal protein S12 methylthiotransferase
MGCPKNMVDSRHLLDNFLSEGFKHKEEPYDADIVLINTCGFIKDATEESISEILSLAQQCDKNKDCRLVVFGCLASRYREDLLKEIPEIDAIFGVAGGVRVFCLYQDRRRLRQEMHLLRYP